MTLNLATWLTLFRIVAIPLFILSFYLGEENARPIATAIFALASITDLLDGYVARRYNQITPFGTFLDPVADKLIVATALVLLVQADPRLTLAVIAIIIIGREITVSALREWMASFGDSTAIAVNFIAKFKTTMQMIGIGCMVLRANIGGINTYDLGILMLLIAAGLTMWSMWVYLRAAWPALSGRAPP